MLKKTALSALAALGLLAAPGAVAASAAPEVPTPTAPAEPPVPVPFRGTDARSTRYYVPKGVRQRARSRFTHFLHACFDVRLPNRWMRRSVARAAYAGRGRAGELKAEKFLVREIRDPATGKLTGARQSTRRAAERAAKAVAFERDLCARRLAAHRAHPLYEGTEAANEVEVKVASQVIEVAS